MAPAKRYWAVIPAGGRGTRMQGQSQGQSPKQYLDLDGKTLLEHALAPFLALRWIAGIVVVLPAADRIFAGLACARDPRVRTATGGVNRAESVLAGLRAVAERESADCFVLVHDAARPCLRSGDVQRLCECASDGDGGLLAVPVADTIKRSEGDRAAATVDRRELWRAQTPQLFPLGALRQALERALEQNLDVTDESRVMEAAGLRPRLVPGHVGNLKVTAPGDLELARFWLAARHGRE